MLNYKLNNNYLITGATSGIGKALVVALLKLGANVLGVGRVETKIQDIIERYPETFSFQSRDLGTQSDLEIIINEFIAKYGKFHGMVYCAGKEETLPITIYSPGKLADIFNVNFNTPFELLRLLSKKKNCENLSSFIFISSVMGELGQPGKTGYCASKSAILGLVKAAALELAPMGIRVNAVSPGIVNTPMSQQLLSLLEEGNKQKIIDMHPLGLGEVEDIVPLILFLLSVESRWITGQNIKIDGGYSIQ